MSRFRVKDGYYVGFKINAVLKYGAGVFFDFGQEMEVEKDFYILKYLLDFLKILALRTPEYFFNVIITINEVFN